jgi:hypothetical protein
VKVDLPGHISRGAVVQADPEPASPDGGVNAGYQPPDLYSAAEPFKEGV